MNQINDRLLLVDDEKDLLETYRLILRKNRIRNVELCWNSNNAMDQLERFQPGLVLLDLNMPGIRGEALLSAIRAQYPEVSVIVVTAVNDVVTAVQCLKAGADDFLVKPVDENRLITTIKRSLKIKGLQAEVDTLKDQLLSEPLKQPEAFSSIITRNKGMLAVFKYIEAVAQTSQPILITGETGVGKELIADAIHRASGRSGKYVALNIAGLDDAAFSDTLFGHIRGAFTGAGERRAGLVEQAHDGTLFLDEIGDLDLESQVKLLRLIQEREYFALGSDAVKKTSARIVIATNRDLEIRVEQGNFRKDLFYRLNTHRTHIPALRERLDDVPVLIDCFLGEAAKELEKPKPAVPKELLTLLQTYYYPGNIRELRSLIFNAVATHESHVLSMDSIRKYIHAAQQSREYESAVTNQDIAPALAALQPLPDIKTMSLYLIDEALRRTSGNRSQAAQLLGITRQTLLKRMSEME